MVKRPYFLYDTGHEVQLLTYSEKYFGGLWLMYDLDYGWVAVDAPPRDKVKRTYNIAIGLCDEIKI